MTYLYTKNVPCSLLKNAFGFTDGSDSLINMYSQQHGGFLILSSTNKGSLANNSYTGHEIVQVDLGGSPLLKNKRPSWSHTKMRSLSGFKSAFLAAVIASCISVWGCNKCCTDSWYAAMFFTRKHRARNSLPFSVAYMPPNEPLCTTATLLLVPFLALIKNGEILPL